MKKNYIAPVLLCVKVNTSNMLAGSITASTSTENIEDNGASLGVKSSGSSYNVWDNDWSN